MPADEIKKPSLTSRRSSGSASLKSLKSSPSNGKSKSPLSLSSKKGSLSQSQNKESNKTEGDSEDDISIAKVIIVILGVIIVAVIAAFLVQSLQNSGDPTTDDNIAEDTQDETQNTEESEEDDLTSTGTTTDTDPTSTPEPTEEPDSDTTDTDGTDEPENTPDDFPTAGNTDNDFGTTTQYIVSDVSGDSVRIRTYKYENVGTYNFIFPVDSVNGGATEAPNTKAEYNDAGELVLELRNIGVFNTSCSYINSNNQDVGYNNVNTFTCVDDEIANGVVKMVFDVNGKPEFKLTTGTTDLNGESLGTVELQIN